jgi:hypothetical protein
LNSCCSITRNIKWNHLLFGMFDHSLLETVAVGWNKEDNFATCEDYAVCLLKPPSLSSRFHLWKLCLLDGHFQVMFLIFWANFCQLSRKFCWISRFLDGTGFVSTVNDLYSYRQTLKRFCFLFSSQSLEAFR